MQISMLLQSYVLFVNETPYILFQFSIIYKIHLNLIKCILGSEPTIF